MKSLILLTVIFLAAQFALAKDKYDHIGRIDFYPGTVKYLLEGRTDLHYAGDYTCTPGTDNYAPDCRKAEDWYQTTAHSFTFITLEDGTTIRVSEDPEDYMNVFTRVETQWSLAQNDMQQASTRAVLKQVHSQPGYSDAEEAKAISASMAGPRSNQGTFRYRLGKFKNGQQEIEIEAIGKGHYRQ
jgi:hypothetical protein